jgi:release factor glutamine methyltransferase
MAEETIAETANGCDRTIAQALREGVRVLGQSGIESALLDAEVLLCYVLQVAREQLSGDRERLLGQPTLARYRELLKRRELREPAAYITGKKEFWSLDLLVTPAVLIPRPETELLVEVALQLARPSDRGPEVRLLDVGTGSGALAIALAKELEQARIVATDVSTASLEVARKNSGGHGLSRRIELIHSDLFQAFVSERGFDFIIANPPYVRSSELQTLAAEICDWEPVVALDGGRDGLEYYRRIAVGAHRHLREGGYVLLEIGADMAADVTGLFGETARYASPIIYQDYAGRDRVFATKIVHKK